MHVLPPVRRAGPPCIGNKECSSSAQTRIEFCRSVCFSCHMPGSVSLDAHMICLAASCVSIRGSAGELRISSRSSWRRALDAVGARARARSGSRVLVYDSYASRYRLECLDACTVRPERARCVPKRVCSVSYTSNKTLKPWRNMRNSQTHESRFRLRAVSDRAIGVFLRRGRERTHPHHRVRVRGKSWAISGAKR